VPKKVVAEQPNQKFVSLDKHNQQLQELHNRFEQEIEVLEYHPDEFTNTIRK
jgi:hypothetical protein